MADLDLHFQGNVAVQGLKLTQFGSCNVIEFDAFIDWGQPRGCTRLKRALVILKNKLSVNQSLNEWKAVNKCIIHSIQYGMSHTEIKYVYYSKIYEMSFPHVLKYIYTYLYIVCSQSSRYYGVWGLILVDMDFFLCC